MTAEEQAKQLRGSGQIRASKGRPAAAEARRRIIQELRRLHRENQPLNLVAAKRRCPKLVKAVYAIKPYWGWKQALADAGLSYAHINTELLDYCTCELCGFDAGILTFHLLNFHHTTPTAYRCDHPQAEIMCETVRARRFLAKGVMPHWERIWSYEYALDRIKELHRRGFPLNFEWVNRVERGLAQYLWLNDHPWDDSLAAVGLQPGRIRKQSKGMSLTKHQVVSELRRRHQTGLSVAHTRLLEENMRLCNAARRRFGSYEAALTAAKLSPDEIRLRKRNFNPAIKARVFEELRRVASLQGEQRTEAARAMRVKFHNYIFSHLGNWRKAAKAAGVAPDLVLVPLLYNRRRVLAELRAWKLQGGQLSYTALGDDKASLYRAACKYYGSFAKAVRAAGLKIDGRQLYGKRELSAALRAWQAQGHRLKDGIMVRENYPLCRSAKLWHGTLAAAVKAAGLVEPTLKSGPKLYLKELIPGLLRAWKAAGKRLMISDMDKQKPGLAEAVRREFGGLAAALKAAGLEPDRREVITPANVLETLRRWAAGRTGLYAKDFRIEKPGHYAVMLKAYGPWAKTLRRIGLEPGANPGNKGRRSAIASS